MTAAKPQPAEGIPAATTPLTGAPGRSPGPQYQIIDLHEHAREQRAEPALFTDDRLDQEGLGSVATSEDRPSASSDAPSRRRRTSGRVHPTFLERPGGNRSGVAPWPQHRGPLSSNGRHESAYIEPGARLVGEALDEINLCGNDLTGVDLSDASLRRATLHSATLTGARLDRADLSHADLTRAALPVASLVGTTLTGTTLREANLSQARLDDADLSGADLTNANLQGASLRGCNLANATLRGTKLDEADLRFARGIWFDETEIRRTRITVQIGLVGRLAGRAWLLLTQWRCGGEQTPRASWPYSREGTDDAWSALRRSYTGPAFARTLLALILFLLPNVLRTAGLVFVSDAESQLLDVATTIARTFAAPEADGEMPSGSTADAPWHWLASALERAENGPRYEIWEVMLGLHKEDWQSRVLALLFGVLLFYNLALRYPLTVAVSGLREAEERSDITPARSEYEHLYQLHRVASVLWWVALLSGIVNLGRWLLSEVIFVW